MPRTASAPTAPRCPPGEGGQPQLQPEATPRMLHAVSTMQPELVRGGTPAGCPALQVRVSSGRQFCRQSEQYQ